MAGKGSKQEETEARKAGPALLSIGALAQATDVPVATLRTWEMRYGYPLPERKPSGHRVYPLSSVPRLRRIAEALNRGYRAAEVVPASEGQLSQLLSAVPPYGAAVEVAAMHSEEPLEMVRHFDSRGLTRLLTSEWARLGPLDFLQGRSAPLLHQVGEEWSTGSLDVAHEHFLSERVGDLLRSLRLPFDERARGAQVVLATLPGELHELGLQMAALVLAVSGCNVCYLGADVPVEQIARHAKDLRARAVGLSVSTAHDRRRTNEGIKRLREKLPRRIPVLVGGDGVPVSRTDVKVVKDLEELQSLGMRLAE
ncbi:MAG: cobalamin B12-binding domain-containing protein [Myxococcales bacterium]|nr:MAG: cobalamin B12-binding domain-containing protein [Myxococcales bacterium]